MLWMMMDLIFIIIFNAMFFILGGTDHSVSVWISYGFIHFAYLMLIVTPFFMRRGKSEQCLASRYILFRQRIFLLS